MIILRHGIAPANVLHDVECLACHSLLRFATSEAQVVNSARNEQALRVKCPVCGAHVTKYLY